MKQSYLRLLDLIETELSSNETAVEVKLQWICDTLCDRLPNYDWTGFYFHQIDKDELYLKAFCGEPTEHTHIPFGKGICGQVALSNQTFLVPDVSLQDNYISCGITVKSEIVVPIFVKGNNIGQIDIDSHVKNAFDQDDVQFLEKVAELVGGLY